MSVTRKDREAALAAIGCEYMADSPTAGTQRSAGKLWLDHGGMLECGEYSFSVDAEGIAAAIAQAREEGRREGAEQALAAAAGAAFVVCQPNYGNLFAAIDDGLETAAQRMSVSYREKR